MDSILTDVCANDFFLGCEFAEAWYYLVFELDVEVRGAGAADNNNEEAVSNHPGYLFTLLDGVHEFGHCKRCGSCFLRG